MFEGIQVLGGVVMRMVLTTEEFLLLGEPE